MLDDSRMEAIHIEILETIHGGADQTRLRTLAKSWCPQTYARNANQRTLTRRMGEQCLDEAGMGQYKNMLDSYFTK